MTREMTAGDDVWHPMHGNGYVVDVKQDSHGYYTRYIVKLCGGSTLELSRSGLSFGHREVADA